MLYRRTDLVPHPPRDLAELSQLARRAQDDHGVPFGFVWQGARYEGLVTVFLEHLGAFGGAILDDEGRVVVDSEAAEQALTYMRDAIYVDGVVPPAVLTWQEEQTRFAFQTGQAVFMRNWPYAYGLLQDRVAVERGRAIRGDRRCPARPADRRRRRLAARHWRSTPTAISPRPPIELIDYLLQPEQMIERARVAGQYPTRPALYTTARAGRRADHPTRLTP